jgi:hypothetical protein
MALLGTVISSNIASPTITGSANISSSLANAHTAYASGGYTAGTWYDIFTGETGLNNGMYIMVCYASNFTAGGGHYFWYMCSVPFYWAPTGTNSGSNFTFPDMLGTGLADNGYKINLRLKMNFAVDGGVMRLQMSPSHTLTGLSWGTNGKELGFFLKKIGG